MPVLTRGALARAHLPPPPPTSFHALVAQTGGEDVDAPDGAEVVNVVMTFLYDGDLDYERFVAENAVDHGQYGATYRMPFADLVRTKIIFFVRPYSQHVICVGSRSDWMACKCWQWFHTNVLGRYLS